MVSDVSLTSRHAGSQPRKGWPYRPRRCHRPRQSLYASAACLGPQGKWSWRGGEAQTAPEGRWEPLPGLQQTARQSCL